MEALTVLLGAVVVLVLIGMLLCAGCVRFLSRWADEEDQKRPRAAGVKSTSRKVG